MDVDSQRDTAPMFHVKRRTTLITTRSDRHHRIIGARAEDSLKGIATCRPRPDLSDDVFTGEVRHTGGNEEGLADGGQSGEVMRRLSDDYEIGTEAWSMWFHVKRTHESSPEGVVTLL